MSIIRLLCCWSIVAGAVVGGEAAKSPYKTTSVIIMIVDGARWTETFGEPTRQYIPHLAKDLAPLGVVYSNFRNDGPTYTNAGHTAISTGFYQEINNSGKELPGHATIFQRYLAASKAAASDAWIVTTKDKLDILADCLDAQWAGKYRASTDCGKSGNGSGYREDPVTFKRAGEVLAQQHPHLMLINFKQPDAAGHANDWPGYLQGIRDDDVYAWKLWQALQADANYAGHTALFITNDHGRHLDGHKDGFVNHGDDCEGCHHIELVALGPDFQSGMTSDVKRGQIDLAATVAELLRFELTGSSGQVMRELFVSAPAAAPAVGK